MTLSNEEARWLIDDEINSLITACQRSIVGGKTILKLLHDLRKTTSADRAALIVEQARLRIRAAKKFSLASQMYFTRPALEMATDEVTANFKSQRFHGLKRIADICSGVGGDAISLASASAFPLSAFDNQPVMVTLATANAKAHHVEFDVQNKAFDSIELSCFDAVHIDPERRSQGRTVQGERFSPSVDDILDHFHRHSIPMAIKVAPATRLVNQPLSAIERQWIGGPRECKQQMIWTGDLARHPNCRSVVRLAHGQVFDFVCAEDEVDRTTVAKAQQLDDYLYEPHNAVLAANLENALAAHHGLFKLGQGIAYFTSENKIAEGLLACFQVIDSVSARQDRVSEMLRRNQIGQLEFKKRGVPESLVNKLKQIRCSGDRRGCLIVTEFSGKRLAILADRIDQVKTFK